MISIILCTPALKRRKNNGVQNVLSPLAYVAVIAIFPAFAVTPARPRADEKYVPLEFFFTAAIVRGDEVRSESNSLLRWKLYEYDKLLIVKLREISSGDCFAIMFVLVSFGFVFLTAVSLLIHYSYLYLVLVRQCSKKGGGSCLCNGFFFNEIDCR